MLWSLLSPSHAVLRNRSQSYINVLSVFDHTPLLMYVAYVCVPRVLFTLTYKARPSSQNSIKSLIIWNWFISTQSQPGIQLLHCLDKQVRSTVEWLIKPLPIPPQSLLRSPHELWKSSAFPCKEFLKITGDFSVSILNCIKTV